MSKYTKIRVFSEDGNVVRRGQHIHIPVPIFNGMTNLIGVLASMSEMHPDMDKDSLEEIRSFVEKLKCVPGIDTSNAGYVYLIKDVSMTGHYKIGKTRNPHDRLSTFGVKLPFEIETVCLIRCDRYHELESNLHRQFADKRVNGEWFNLSPEDVEYIKGLAYQETDIVNTDAGEPR